MANFLWKIGGEAGFGIMTVGLSFAKIAAKSGYHIFDYNEYPSLIRGGHNTFEVVVSDEEIGASKWDIDLLVCLNKETYQLHKHRLTDQSLVIYDPDEFTPDSKGIQINVPFKKIRSEHKVVQVMMNTVALGATLGLLDGDINLLYQIIEKDFQKKGEEIIEFNRNFAKIGYEHITENYSGNIMHVLTPKNNRQKYIFAGNDAFSLGAAIADCRLYAAYPMTPASSVLTTLAGWQKKSGMVVRHAEDEISVINEALGASFAGVRSAVGTSGGGFALMVESLSFAGIAEIPIVIYLGMRPGPATGMPTWTEQGELLFAVHAGHGEFPKIVLTPGDAQETLELTIKAFDLADIYQTPVIVMADKFIGESHKSQLADEVTSLFTNYQPNRGKTVTEVPEGNYLRYQMADDGISPRLIPGKKGIYYQANSYEHVEDGHTTEDVEPRVKQVDKRSQKMVTYLKNDFKLPRIFGNLETAETIIVSWGGNKGPILEAQKILHEQGKDIVYIHFTHIFPLSVDTLLPYFNLSKRYILLENNSHGQFGKLLRMETGIDIKDKILKYDGRPFYPEEIVGRIMKL